MAWTLIPLLLLLAWTASMGSARARTDLLNVCMDAKHHKAKPGPEDKLHNQVRKECGSGWGGGLLQCGRSQGGGGSVDWSDAPTSWVIAVGEDDSGLLGEYHVSKDAK